MKLGESEDAKSAVATKGPANTLKSGECRMGGGDAAS